MEVNREQAERCRDLGATAMRQGNYPKAIKFLTKSLQLYDALPGVAALLAQANGLQQQQSSGTGSARTSNGASSSHAAPARSASTASSATSTDQTGADGRAYTEEQVRIVKKVLAARQGGRGAHYRVLGLTQSCSEAEIKKAYRKLSLKVHPDKNSAPQADEAFKAVGLAYATLSDGQKRTIYNQSGEEDPDRNPGGMAGFRRGGGGGGMHMHGQRMDPEDIFNMFFQGGMGGGGRGPGGVHFYSNGFGPGMQFPGGGPRRRPRAAPGGGPAEQPEPSPMGNLFQFLPIIVMMLLSFLRYSGDETRGPMPGEQRYFSLTHKPPFKNPLQTKLSKVKEIPFFVSDKFLRTYYRDQSQLVQVERMVERAYEEYLVDECKKQGSYKTSLERKSQQERNAAERQRKAQKAHEFELSRCMELDDLFPNRRKGRNAFN